MVPLELGFSSNFTTGGKVGRVYLCTLKHTLSGKKGSGESDEHFEGLTKFSPDILSLDQNFFRISFLHPLKKVRISFTFSMNPDTLVDGLLLVSLENLSHHNNYFSFVSNRTFHSFRALSPHWLLSNQNIRKMFMQHTSLFKILHQNIRKYYIFETYQNIQKS